MTDRDGIVFRIERGQGRGLGCVTGGFALLAVVGFGLEGFVTFWGIVAIATAVGYFLGNAAKQGRCSRCGGRLPTDEGRCPKCGGLIHGTVSSARDASIAEKALEDDD